MKTTIINGIGKRYLSELPEFSDGIPFGVVNKKLTDVGGTFCAINCQSNYIVVVPFRDLATSIECDVNNKYKVFKMFGGILKTPFKEYVKNNIIKKFAVTYDSLEKLTNWLINEGENLDNYKILVDEYHLILEDLDFRDEAINSLINIVDLYKHKSYLSATPINPIFEFDFLKELPHYEVDFGATSIIEPFKIKTVNVYKAAVSLINEVKSGLFLDDIDGNNTKVEELHIFVNSVTGISQICSSANLSNDDVKIVCADRVRNSLILKDYEISSITSPNAPINFYTKKGFQGCNVFSNNALVVVISDAKISHTLVDIETSLIQIVGRIRLNDFSKNVFRNKLYHIYSTNSKIKTDKEFEDFIMEKRSDANNIYEDLNNMTDEKRLMYIKRMDFESDLLSVINNRVYLNLKKEQLFRYKHELRKSYKNGLTVKEQYLKSTKFENTKQYYSEFDDILLSKIVKVGLKDLYNLFLENEELESFKLEYPEFYEYKKYLKVSEMNTLKWNKSKIDNLLLDKKTMDLVHRKVYDSINIDFISSGNLKELYKEKMDYLGIKLTAKGSMIEDNKYLVVNKSSKRINGKVVTGYYIDKLKYVL